jgi:thiamine pyrophosphokinase
VAVDPRWLWTDGVDVVVLAGGDPVAPTLLPDVPADATIIAADGGVELTRALGRPADLLVGDLDSTSHQMLAAARSAGTRVEVHDRDKYRTDLAIALDAALAHAPARVLVLGGHGGRLDHLLANALLLCAPRYAPLDLVAQAGPAIATVVRDVAELHGSPGDTVSLLPVHGAAHGVRTRGLRWALDDETLAPGSSRGVSNELIASPAAVRVTEGTVLAVQPGRLG